MNEKTVLADDEVERAARLAQVHDFVTDLADGYDTAIGDRGRVDQK